MMLIDDNGCACLTIFACLILLLLLTDIWLRKSKLDRMTPLGPAFRGALLATLLLLIGCGSQILFDPNGEVPILPSTQIATGAWTIEGDTAAGVPNVYPIGGFLGALTVNGDGDAVLGSFGFASSDGPGSYMTAACLGNTFGLNATGTIVNGLLTLDSDFDNNHLHLTGQLSPNRQNLTSGSYTVTGPCATTAPNLDGHWNAPLTGTYKGQLNSLSGTNPQVTATLTQASYYWGYGYIPVEGNILFTTAGCTTTVQLNGGYLVGYLDVLGGYTSSTTYYNGIPANNVLVSGFEDPPSQTISDISWGYPDSGCGAQTGDPYNSGTLTRQ
jgi:hypothetical protein